MASLDSLTAWILRQREREAVRIELYARGASAPISWWAIPPACTESDAAHLAREIDAERREDYAEQGFSADVVYLTRAYGAPSAVGQLGPLVGEKPKTIRPAAALAKGPDVALDNALPHVIEVLVGHTQAIMRLHIEAQAGFQASSARQLLHAESIIDKQRDELALYAGRSVDVARVEATAQIGVAKAQGKALAAAERTRAIRGAFDGVRETLQPVIGAVLAASGRPEGVALILEGLTAEQVDKLRARLPGALWLAMLRRDPKAIATAIAADPSVFDAFGEVLTDAQLVALSTWWQAIPAPEERGAEPEGTTV